MLKAYIMDGGTLMIVLVAIMFAVLFLISYAAMLLGIEMRRARRFRARWRVAADVSIEPIRRGMRDEKSVVARFVANLLEKKQSGALAAADSSQDEVARAVEDEVLGELVWPLDVLQFLAEYASKIGLCGTILGLCLHFLSFGVDGDSSVASRAMAVALYTTLGALAIALIAEPAVYVLGWVERWLRRDLRAWASALTRVEGDAAPDNPVSEGNHVCTSELPPQPESAATEAGHAE